LFEPAYLLIAATWYAVEDQPIRIGWWSTYLGVANSFGDLLAFGVGHIKAALESWQYQFIFIGAISCAWAVLMAFTPQQREYSTLNGEPIKKGRQLITPDHGLTKTRGKPQSDAWDQDITVQILMRSRSTKLLGLS
jgi:hypothetical protein